MNLCDELCLGTHGRNENDRGDDSYDKKSTLITSQRPVDQWHAYLGDRTIADAILDRLVHNSYRLVLKGESMRKGKTASPATPSLKAKR